MGDGRRKHVSTLKNFRQMGGDAMSEQLVRKVVLAALGGRLKIDAPKATDKEISLAIMEAAERGLVKACDVSHQQSHYPEWMLLGPTGASERFIRETRPSKKVWAIGAAIVAGILAFLAWLIPVVVSIMKK